MIQLRTRLKVADNSGAKELMVLGVPKKRRQGAALGEVLTATVRKADPLGEVKTHQLVRCVIVRRKKESRRPDGSYIRFDDNAAVILENVKTKNPQGTRIFGPVAREMRELGYDKIISLAKEVY